MAAVATDNSPKCDGIQQIMNMASNSDSSSSSSIADFSGDEGTVYGLQPYLFEPQAADYLQENQSDQAPPINHDPVYAARLDNRDW